MLGVWRVITILRSTDDLLKSVIGEPFREHLAVKTSASLFVNQTNLTSVSTLVLLLLVAWSPDRNPSYTPVTHRTALGPVLRLRLHRWAITGGVM